MNTFKRFLFALQILSIAIVSGFSQDNALQKVQTDTTKEVSRSVGLRKITTHSSHDRDFDIHIDEQALEANIESAIKSTMKSVEVALEKIEIRIDHLKLDIPNIDIEPIEIDLPDLGINRDNHHHFDFNSEEGIDQDNVFRKGDSTNKDKNKVKNKQKDKSNKKDKSKGLKKLN